MSGTWNRRSLGIALVAGVTALAAGKSTWLEPLSQVGKPRARACSRERSTCTFTWIPGRPARSTGRPASRTCGWRASAACAHSSSKTITNRPRRWQLPTFAPEVPGLQELYGGFVLNLPNGGVNPAGVEFMATRIKEEPGRIVWMPAGDTAKEIRESKNPNGPFVAVSRNGELLPGVKEVIAIVAKHGLVIASGHILAEKALMVFREAWRRPGRAAL